jgi:uncharacterized protein (DUF488 family)
MIERILTIGAYGFDQQSFIDRLTSAGADLFVDIRARRGMRGAAYAFANAARLQESLAAAGIPYTHARELAPSQEVRDAQYAVDAQEKTAKRKRTTLSPTFVEFYRNCCLSSFDTTAFIATHCASARRPVLFCVEREPAACHRSMVAERMAADLSLPVDHLMP